MELFKFYSPKNLRFASNSFSYYGWEGKGSFAWKARLLGFKNGLDALYEAYKRSNGDPSKLDTLVYPICFISRQIVELAIKYLYFKYSTDSQKTLFFKRANHNLKEAWNKLEPIISKIKEDVNTAISIGDIEDVVLQMNDFDKTSMRMRYPIDKNLKPMNNEAQRLDVHHFYEQIKYFYNIVIRFVDDIDNTIPISNDNKAMKQFVDIYRQNKDTINKFLEHLKLVKTGNNELEYMYIPFSDLNINEDYLSAFNLYNSFNDDTKIIIECLYYAGRESTFVNLPKSEEGKIRSIITLCLNHMQLHNMEFGKSLERLQVNLFGKEASTIIKFSHTTMEYLDKYIK